ncbi:hypothetical protein [Thermoactinospora rubra]|uniref:hypothetical protein n=1 Tax=Thermoactinospora rubra TaxID=1088767 RepID=UPI000A122D32|nr:hypothetical protein [Thermoactinospora rubra]
MSVPLPVRLVGVVTAGLLALALHVGWLVTQYGLLALPLGAAALLAALSVYGTALAALARRAGRPAFWTGMALAALGLLGPVALLAWPEARVAVRFAVERPAFEAVAALWREDRLPAADGYLGARLPGPLCFVSANCHVTSFGPDVLYVPDRLGIPDDSQGYAYFAGEVDSGPYDGYGMLICPEIRLSERWWWMGRC